ncbi:helix-turn-helix domain-containing protein [Clostridium botulinum]|uniref:helix-turn-helix domain-containing protein n=1 Tax=Clostridium botulinum TaxID=1491 RepID=UPI001C9A8DCF|nr:helix-turn-helix transcriptional regulator [Clostridium botulinum]MBY6929781.1 helix-turn-helix transcriptional regulator [Clostridium botulinum]
MIGLEFICKLYDKQFKDLAEELGVSKQVINGWIKGKYKISKKHLPKLAEIFKQKEECFQKELTDVEQIEIQQKKIRNELIEYEYENTFIDEDSGEKVTIIETQPDQEQQYEDNFLEFKKNIIKLHNKIDSTIGSEFRNGVIDSDINLNADLFDAERLLELYEMFAEMIKRGTISRDTIKKILKGMRHYEGRSFSKDRDILEVSRLIKQIENK